MCELSTDDLLLLIERARREMERYEMETAWLREHLEFLEAELRRRGNE